MDLKVLEKSNFFDLSIDIHFSFQQFLGYSGMWQKNKTYFTFIKVYFSSAAFVALSKICIPYFELVYNQKLNHGPCQTYKLC